MRVKSFSVFYAGIFIIFDSIVERRQADGIVDGKKYTLSNRRDGITYLCYQP